MAVTQNTYVGNGSTVLYSFTFPYLEASDIRVSVDGANTTAYSLVNATTVEFNTAPNNGAKIRIYRRTSDEQLKATFFPGSAIRAQDLNDDFTQNLYVTQESVNEIDGAVQTSKDAMVAAGAAVVTAGEAKQIAEGAVTIAATADQKANAAVNTANNAETVANSTINTANTAAAKADSAIAAVNAAALFVPVPDVASIPSNPTDRQSTEVTDSTGIESFQPLFGLPAGFIGDAGKSVRLVYSVDAQTWFYYGYAVNDPDNRYLQESTADGKYQPIGSYLTPSDASSTYLAKTDASTTYLSKTDAASTYQPTGNYAKLDTTQTFTKAQRGAPVALTDQAVVVADFAAANHFTLSLGGNRQLGVPSNPTAGQSGTITITNGGANTLSFTSVWKFSGGTAPTITANGKDVLAYYVESPTSIVTRFIGDVK